MVHMENVAKWVDDTWVGFDTETTGTKPSSDRLVTAAVVPRARGRSAGVTPNSAVQTWLVKPVVEIPPGATAIHGVTTQYAKMNGLPVATVLEEVNASLAAHLSLGRPLVVFNAGFDLPLLAAESVRHGVTPLAQRLPSGVVPVIDPLVLDRSLVVKRRGKRTLANLAGAYRVAIPGDTHRAEVDAELTLNLLAAMVASHPILASMDAADLHQFQKEGHARWAADLQRYFHSVGRDSTVNHTWF